MFNKTAQLGGIVLALGIAGAIFVNKATQELLQLLPDANPADVKNSITGMSSGFFKTLTESQQAAALGIIVSAIDDV
jgi:hypothetical protein